MGAARSFSPFISLSFLLSSLNLAASPLHTEAAKELHVGTSSDWNPERFAPRVLGNGYYMNGVVSLKHRPS